MSRTNSEQNARDGPYHFSRVARISMACYHAAMDTHELMDLPTAARLTGLHPATLRRRCQHGLLRHRLIGRSYATTLAWIAESEQAPQAMGRPRKKSLHTT